MSFNEVLKDHSFYLKKYRLKMLDNLNIYINFIGDNILLSGVHNFSIFKLFLNLSNTYLFIFDFIIIISLIFHLNSSLKVYKYKKKHLNYFLIYFEQKKKIRIFDFKINIKYVTKEYTKLKKIYIK